MSIRVALIGGMSALLLIGIGVVAVVGTTGIRQNVVREAQTRVDHDLTMFESLYEKEMRLAAEQFRFTIDQVEFAAQDATHGQRLVQLRQQLGFAVLNCCGPEGEPLAGSFPKHTTRVPVDRDPVLRAALRGEFAHGTVLLGPDRLQLEGGAALATSQTVPRPDGWPDGGTTESLFQWYAAPILDSDGKVISVIYGGRPLNHNIKLVDLFVDLLFGDSLYEGKPVGTVTVFLDGTRVATNVRDANGKRAVGTQVSDEVRRHVLAEGKRWRNRAWVVDAWYISGYEPLRDPDGETIGMLYVGLLEAPYNALQTQMIYRFALPTAILLGLALIAAVLVVNGITRPLGRLQRSAGQIAEGSWDSSISAGRSYREITELSDALHRMQEAIKQRDRNLRAKNEQLAETNEQLAKANSNYMNMLGFVTHELKAPLANIQSLINLLVEGYVCEVPEKGTDTLKRIKRNCEELQDMVKDYLDLSRAERDELVAEKREIDLVADVVAPCTSQMDALFHSRNVTLEINVPDSVELHADPELLRIALTNYLNNAAKYGRDGGRAVLTATQKEAEIFVEVWNEGNGFASEEAEGLFKKFSRLDNENTKSRKGSGLGLYLCAQVIGQHGGRAWAESDPGQWAKFCFSLPASAAPSQKNASPTTGS